MGKKKPKKKLSLNKETVRKLTEDELSKVAGGMAAEMEASSTWTTGTCTCSTGGTIIVVRPSNDCMAA